MLLLGCFDISQTITGWIYSVCSVRHSLLAVHLWSHEEWFARASQWTQESRYVCVYCQPSYLCQGPMFSLTSSQCVFWDIVITLCASVVLVVRGFLNFLFRFPFLRVPKAHFPFPKCRQIPLVLCEETPEQFFYCFRWVISQFIRFVWRKYEISISFHALEITDLHLFVAGVLWASWMLLSDNIVACDTLVNLFPILCHAREAKIQLKLSVDKRFVGRFCCARKSLDKRRPFTAILKVLDSQSGNDLTDAETTMTDANWM